MIIIMEEGAPRQAIDEMIAAVEAEGFRPFVNPGVERTVIAVLGVVHDKVEIADKLSTFASVERVVLVSEPYKLVSRAHHPQGSIFDIRGVKIGGPEICVIAGPCSVESRDQTLEIAHAVKAAGAHMLRGGAFKPRTSPYAFQGMGEAGLQILAEARDQTGLPVVTEVMDYDDCEVSAHYADVLQVGARNMQNFRLLQKLGTMSLPVLLKRGFGCKIDDLMMAAEYIMAGGNAQVILCERGIITFETATRFTTDINAIPVIKHHSHLPVIVDPSHAAGDWRYVADIALAAIAGGADGLEVEVHNHPEKAMSDSAQALRPEMFAAFMARARRVAEAVDRTIQPPVMA
jgi:3-deoxy-7-phosphoheptulonate synthase